MSDAPFLSDFVALDFETANRHPNSACALGLVTVVGRRIVDAAAFLIRPEPLVFESGNVRVHGITPALVRDRPTLGELWPQIEPYLHEKVWVAHNAGFDMKVLAASLRGKGITPPRGRYFCSWRLARKVFPGLRSYGLGALAAQFDIEIRHHDALSDARACALLSLQALERAGIARERDFRALGLELRRFDLELFPATTLSLQTSPLRFDLPLPGESLAGRQVAFSGELSRHTRDEAEDMAWRAGAQVTTRIAERTDFLVVGQRHGADPILTPKLRAALQLRAAGGGIRLIDEATFEALAFAAGSGMMGPEEEP